jgi:hypothetical protein
MNDMREKLRELAAEMESRCEDSDSACYGTIGTATVRDWFKRIDAILAEPAGEAVAWADGETVETIMNVALMKDSFGCTVPLYTTPPAPSADKAGEAVDGCGGDGCEGCDACWDIGAVADDTAQCAPSADKAGVEGTSMFADGVRAAYEKEADPSSQHCPTCRFTKSGIGYCVNCGELFAAAPPTNSAETGSKVVDAPQTPGGECAAIQQEAGR